MDVVLDFIRWHDGIPFAISVACLILALILAWSLRRDRVREIVAENEAGIYCPHGKYRYHSCRPCAEDFVRQAEAERTGEAPKPFPSKNFITSTIGAALGAWVGHALAEKFFGGNGSTAEPGPALPAPRKQVEDGGFSPGLAPTAAETTTLRKEKP